MKVLEINSISKEDSYIYYINRYKGKAVIELMAHKITFPLSFSIEVNPLGIRNVEIEFAHTDIDYPLLPITKSLKSFIDEMSKNGQLP